MHSGELIFHFINVIVLTGIAAPWILWRYRVAVFRGMRASSDAAVAVRDAGERATGAAAAVVPDVERWIGSARRKIAIAVAAAILPPSLILAGLYILVSEYPRSPAHLWLITAVFASAAVPMAAVFLAIPFWRTLALWCLTITTAALLGVGIAVLQRFAGGQNFGIEQFMMVPYFLAFVGVEWSVPLLLLWITGTRRLRGVAPVTFAGLLVFGLAPLAGARLTALAGGWERASPWLLSLGVNAGFYLIALPAGWLAWKRLKTLAAEFDRKCFSEAQLLARTWWLMFVASVAITLANVHETQWLVIFTVAAAAYLIFPGCLAKSLKTFQGSRPRPAPRTLLLLRVFGYRTRTEKLFDGIAQRWRLLGPVTMIAGPDVIARTVDPGDFLRYLAGHLSEAFVNTRADLDARLAAFDDRPDPDGRYRINEFCCRENSWQATVVELMRRADAVIMDARGITASHRGCEFELQQLAAQMRPDEIVVLVDGPGARSLVEKSVADRNMPAPPAIVELPRQTAAATSRVFATLIAAAYGPSSSSGR